MLPNAGKVQAIGIIGTRMAMETVAVRGISSAAVVVPQGAELDEVHESYAAMATAGRVTDTQRRVFFAAGDRLCREQGAEVVLLGGTDLFLAFQGCDAGFPVLDCADVNVEAIHQASLQARTTCWR
jgi:aspartate racemase